MIHILLRRALVPALAAVALVALAACGGDADDAGGSAATKGPVTVDVVMKDMVFEPKTFTFSAGQTVTFKLTNSGPSLHNMHIVSSDVEPKNAATQPTEAGKPSELTVTFPKKGTYKFQCDLHVPDMAGSITVN